MLDNNIQLGLTTLGSKSSDSRFHRPELMSQRERRRRDKLRAPGDTPPESSDPSVPIMDGFFLRPPEQRNIPAHALEPIKLARYAARRLILDVEGSKLATHVETAMDEAGFQEWIDEFARPPFDHTYVEFWMPVNDDKNVDIEKPPEAISSTDPNFKLWRFGVLTSPKRWWFFADIAAKLTMMRAAYDPATGKIVSWSDPDLGGMDPLVDHEHGLRPVARIAQIVFLLIAKNAVTVLRERPAGHRLVKGKRVAYAAKREITLHLSKVQEVYRQRQPGPEHVERRAHEVRGHYAHYHCVSTPGHEHGWVKVEPDEDRPGDRWVCGCGALRVWRRSHMRGNAAIGHVQHDYKVTV